MAAIDYLAEFRQAVDEPADETEYTDAELISVYLEPYTGEDGVSDVEAAAARLWRVKAGKYHKLVTVSEAGSSRALSDLLKNALHMAKSYEDKVASRTTVETSRRARTRAIERA